VHCPPWTTGLWIEHPGSRLEYGADVEYASKADRAKVHLWQYYSNPNQDVKDYQYRIGAAIQSWPCDWMWNQDWWIWDPPF
jgi:hypothetical protein